MTVPLKLTKPESPGAGRRSTRISIAIPITISGKDASGRAFKENTRTVILNKHGAKIVTVHQLALGTELTLENRALGRTAKATVAWLGDRPSPREPAEMGIQLAEAENIWGIELPPDDWQEGPPPKEAKQEIRQSPGPASSAIPAPTPSAVPASNPPAAPPGLQPAAAPDLKPPIPAEGQARFDSHTQTQSGRPPDKAIEKQVREMEKRLDALRADLEALQAGVQNLQESIGSETGKARRDAQASLALSVQSASGELNDKVRQSLEEITAKVEEYQAQLSRQAGSTLEELRSQSGSLLEGLQAQLDKAVSAAQERAASEALDKLQRISSDLVAALGKDFQIKASSSMEPLLEQLRNAGGTAVAEGRKQLSRVRQQTLEGLEKEVAKLVEDYTVRLRKQLQDLQEQQTREIEDSLTSALEKRREGILKRVKAQLEQASLPLQEKSLDEFREKIREELLKQLEEGAAEFDKRTQENLELFSHQLNEKKDESVAQATEMVRTTIGQMFLGPRPDAGKPSEREDTKKRS